MSGYSPLHPLTKIQSSVTVQFDDYAIFKMHRFYNKEIIDSIGGSESYYLLLKLGDCDLENYFTFSFESEAEATLTIYKSPTITDYGTKCNLLNRYIASTNTTVHQLFKGVAVSDDGTQIAQYKMGSGKKAGGGTGISRGLIIPAESLYLFKLTNNTASDNWADWLIDLLCV